MSAFRTRAPDPGGRRCTSVPGPVCYGRGGTEPTVTDADLMLGYLDPQFFLGGEMIRPFAFAMLIGVLVGTYSSIYIAAPTLMVLEERFGGGGGKS